jgi:hypothetical protein
MDMNHFSYDVMRKEKIRDLQAEGMKSQAFHRSGAPKSSLLGGLPKLIFMVLSVLVMLAFLVR